MFRRLDFQQIRADLVAGITVAMVLIPHSLANAQLAGLPPHYGLYAALLPPVVASFFGSSRHLSTGPVALLSLMTLATLSPFYAVGSDDFISYAILLALLLGLFQFSLGFLKLGAFVSFLSHPVIYGFTNAAALIIATTQLPNLFGITSGQSEKHLHMVFEVLSSVSSSTHLVTFIMGIMALISMFILRKVNRKIPYILVVVVSTTLASWKFEYSGAIVGHIPTGLAQFSLPNINFSILSRLSIAVITMTLIGFTEAISVAQAIAIKTKQKLDPNKELIGQGLANIIGSFNQGYPVSGSFARTAVNFQAGAKSWKASLFASLTILITLLFFTQLLYYLPLAVLAAVIVVSVSNLIDISKIKDIWLTNRYDGIAAVLTFFGTLYYAPDLEKGVIIGVVFSVAHYIYRSTHPRIAFLSMYKDRALHDAKKFHLERCKNISVIRFDAPLFFANAKFFENEIIKDLSEHKNITHIVIDASGINEIDATGEEMLRSFIEALEASNKKIYFSQVKAPVLDIMKKTNLYELIGEQNFFGSTKEAIQFLQKTIHKHEDQLKCPLIKYVHVPYTDIHTMHNRWSNILYFLKVLRINGNRK